MRICDADFLSHILQGISDAALMSFVTTRCPKEHKMYFSTHFTSVTYFFVWKQDVQWDKMQGEAWFDPSGMIEWDEKWFLISGWRGGIEK